MPHCRMPLPYTDQYKACGVPITSLIEGMTQLDWTHLTVIRGGGRLKDPIKRLGSVLEWDGHNPSR